MIFSLKSTWRVSRQQEEEIALTLDIRLINVNSDGAFSYRDIKKKQVVGDCYLSLIKTLFYYIFEVVYGLSVFKIKIYGIWRGVNLAIKELHPHMGRDELKGCYLSNQSGKSYTKSNNQRGCYHITYLL